MLQCRTPEVQKILQREFAVISTEEFKVRTDRLVAKINGYRIVKREPVSTEEVILHVPYDAARVFGPGKKKDFGETGREPAKGSGHPSQLD